jgi:hypothetical protein
MKKKPVLLLDADELQPHNFDKENTDMKATKSIRKFDLDTKQGKLFKALVLDRETLTESQISKRFGIKNPTATISTIRQRGYAVYANERVAGNNVRVTEYRHGEASRKMVALAYKAMQAGMTV